MSLKDIEKLKEKIEKDPNSKLFVPLAEEFRKEGMLDDAIQVLLEGIGRQPGYMSARVSLGKMYFEKGMLNEARSEFEDVIKVIPDNLFAHKKLAEIYKEKGERDLAKKAYSTVLKLNALDEDAAASLREIEGGGSPQSGDELAELTKSLSGDISGAQHVLPETTAGENDVLEIVGERSEETGEGISFSDIMESFEISESGTGSASRELKTEDAWSDILQGETFSQSLPCAVPQNKGLSLEDAGICIAEGNYPAAMDIYRRILSTDPDNRKALQSVQELKALLKLLGKDKEVLVASLNTFLDGIRKRRDEFFGSA